MFLVYVSPKNICIPQGLTPWAKSCVKLEINVVHLSRASVILEYLREGGKLSVIQLVSNLGTVSC